MKAYDRGWILVALKGKRPLSKGWQKTAPPPRDYVERWAKKGNIGLVTGPRSGVVVIDDDTPDGSGAASLNLPKTVTVETGSGKRHFYFKAPDPCIGNSAGGLPDHVDVRGEGGQVVFPGSIHPDTNRPYKWVSGLSPEDVELVELPKHVLDLIRKKPKKKSRTKAKGHAGATLGLVTKNEARGALESAVKAVASATQGRRNTILNENAFHLASWIDAGALTRESVEQALTDAASRSGLDDAEIRSTLKSALDAGIRSAKASPGSGGAGGPGRQGASGRPEINLVGGFLPESATQAERALLKSGLQIYQRGEQLVRVVRAPPTTMRGAASQALGRPVITLLDRDYLVDLLTRVAMWMRITEEGPVQVDCPMKVARTYLAREGEWIHPILLNVIETPTLRPDGTLLATPGYDPATCLLFEPGGTTFPAIPNEPTKEDAQEALDRLRCLLKDFPWLDPCDRAVALAAILTALVRPSLRTAPMFAFRAPKMASGKSLLADIVAMISTGRVASVMSQGKDEEEAKKRMLAILMEGTSVACIDNIEEDFGGASLCSILTQESWRERILGKTGTATVPTTTTWLATGNNIRFVGDIITRVLPCDLDPGVERPEERVFDVNLHEYIPAHRGELVAAGLTVLRAFHVAGQPDQGLRVFGRFEQWSEWIRSPLVWLGEADPCDSRARLSQYDPVSAQLSTLLLAWHALLGPAPCTAADVLKRACDKGTRSRALLEALRGVVGEGKGEPTRRFGKYLSKYQRRVESSLRIERVGERQGVALWRVVPVAAPSPVSPKAAEPVGLVGFVGMSPPSCETDRRTRTSVDTGAAPGNTERGGTNPLNPPNPKTSDDGPDAREAEEEPDATPHPGSAPQDTGAGEEDATAPGSPAQDSGSRGGDAAAADLLGQDPVADTAATPPGSDGTDS